MVHAPIAGSAVPPKDIPAALPHSLELRLNVDEPSMVAQLCGVPEGRARQDLAFAALRIGLLAFDQARGQIDADMVAAEGRRLLERIGDLLGASSREMQQGISATLREYFDPQSGRLEERVQRLVRRDGELEEVLKRHVAALIARSHAPLRPLATKPRR